MLLIIEVTWLLMHLQMIPNPFRTATPRMEQQPAGYVVKSQHELRKRGLNSLVWENSESNDTLYYFDSVLTLSQSSATLYLHEQTEVHLSENTLVTIEPQTMAQDSQIRLKFTRGDLRARNPYASTKIESKEWSLSLNQGSEVSLRQTGSDDFEVEVLKGNLEFQKDSKTSALAESQVLKIEDNKISETLKIEKDLKFQGPDYQRIYSFQDEAKIPLTWKGQAEKIQIVPLGEEKVVKTLEPGQSAENLDLRPGKYTLRLLKDGKVSEAKEIEVWKAPTLHLLAPFPRDRVRTQENISFIWSYMPEAREYKFVITDNRTGQIVEKRVKDNAIDFNFLDEADVQWKVIGIDADGFEIPSPYANQIFPRHEIFSAPKLLDPKLRAPASKKKPKPDSSNLRPRSSLFTWILHNLISSAEAQSKKNSADYEAVFAWEPVSGADIYTIEISDSADFRSPKLSKQVKRTEFIWSGFSLGTYYWRVAAGSSKGRMGLFSEPAKVQLEKLPETASNNDGVLIRKKPELEKKRDPVVTKTEVIFNNAPATQFDEKRFEEKTVLATDDQRQLKDTYLLSWTPVWTGWTLNGENELKAKLNGSTQGAAHFQTEQLLSQERSYFVDVFYAQYKWQATDELTYPFQEDQSYTDFKTQILFGDNRSSLLRGGVLQTLPYIERSDLEKVEIKTALAIGPSVYVTGANSERAKSGHSLAVVAGSQVFGLSTQHHWRFLFYKGDSTSLSIGVRAQGDLVFHDRSFSGGWSGGLSLGFEH
ncbi:MAG: hypothetical protein ACAH59_12345 [Pseudobdellovibrionaceae bacterium]